MRFHPLAAALPLSLGLVNSGCQKEAPPPPPAPVAQPAAPAVALPSSYSGKSAPDCITPFAAQGEATELKIAEHTFKKTGSVLTIAEGDEDKQITFGVIANLKEATPENRFNLKRYATFFAEEKAEAVLVAGDSGDTAEEINAVLEAVASSTSLPVLVIPGNREPRAEFQAAVANVASKHANIVNMTQVRLVNFEDASVVSLPGYYDKRFINAGVAGCQYFKEDVDALAPIVKAATGPAVLLAHAEPHGQGKEAIDAFPDGNAGDEYLRLFLAANPVPFGVFANMHEAGGRATDLASNVLKAGEPAPKLYLNVGAADATAWPLNDGTQGNGMVASLTVNNGQASFKAYRAAKLSDAELEEAKKLVPAPVVTATATTEEVKKATVETAKATPDKKSTGAKKK
jgi:Icc-related predicted phosphoesterase